MALQNQLDGSQTVWWVRFPHAPAIYFTQKSDVDDLGSRRGPCRGLILSAAAFLRFSSPMLYRVYTESVLIPAVATRYADEPMLDAA